MPIATSNDLVEHWRSMDSAPRDGTWIEIRNSNGIAPWYALARWSREEEVFGREGEPKVYWSNESQWRCRGGTSVITGAEHHLSWRPYDGYPEEYVDPTGGRQDTREYWRAAARRRSPESMAIADSVIKNRAFDKVVSIDSRRPSLIGRLHVAIASLRLWLVSLW